MQDITEQLNLAKVLIHNTPASHQGTPEAAVEYATSQSDIPPDVVAKAKEAAEYAWLQEERETVWLREQ